MCLPLDKALAVQEADLKLFLQEHKNLKRQYQCDVADSWTEFIYESKLYATFKARAGLELARHPYRAELTEYAAWRWYNWRCSAAVEAMFCSFPGVRAEPNKKHPTIDFYIGGVPFDLKVTNLPNGLAPDKPRDVLNWFYKNQSRERRYSLNNRLFVALPCIGESEAWRLKANLVEIYSYVEEYMLKYSQNKLIRSHFGMVADLIVPEIKAR